MFKTLFSVILFVAYLPLATASEVVKSAQFEGRSDHVTSGGVSIIVTEGQTLLVLEEEFSLDGAPDPKIGFGKNGFDSDTLFSKLENKNGAQVYVIPSNIDVSEFNEVYIWCEKFDIPLGVANFSS
ncbi:MAG: DM13 domain-containing protein [Pseudohongiellaceae bacterium]